MDASRRDFLLKLAKGAAYAAPVVASMSAPERLLAQVSPSQKMGGMAMGKGKPNAVSGFTADPTLAPGSKTAPWTVAPPGSSGPPGGD